MKKTYEIQIKDPCHERSWFTIDSSASLRKMKSACSFHSLSYDTRVILIEGRKKKVVWRENKITKKSLLTGEPARRPVTRVYDIPAAKNGTEFGIQVMTPNMNCKDDAEKVFELIVGSVLIEFSKIFRGYLFESVRSRCVTLIPVRYLSSVGFDFVSEANELSSRIACGVVGSIARKAAIAKLRELCNLGKASK